MIVNIWQNVSHHYKLLDMDVSIHHFVPMDITVGYNCNASSDQAPLHHIFVEVCFVGRDEQVREGGRE